MDAAAEIRREGDAGTAVDSLSDQVAPFQKCC
jgi:hypothetical protein